METTTLQQAVDTAQTAADTANSALKTAQGALNDANLINQLEALTFDHAVSINQLMGNDTDNKNGVSINYPVPAP